MQKNFRQKLKQKVLAPFSGIAILLGMIYLVVWIIGKISDYLRSMPKELAAPLITGAATVLVATATVMLGRYFERKKEIDALYRDKKTEIYDQFLQKFFDLFFNGASTTSQQIEEDLVPFLRDFTRKLVLWSGPEVIAAFVKWKDHLAKGRPDAQTLFLTEQFLLAIRNDLRHPSKGLQKGFFARLFLQNGDLFLTMAATNPNVTLQELADMEKFLSNLNSNVESSS